MERLRFVRPLGVMMRNMALFAAITTSGSVAALAACAPVDQANVVPCAAIADYKLNDVYEQLQSVFTPILDEYEKTSLRRDQREWLKQRDAECKLNALKLSKNLTKRAWLDAVLGDKERAACFLKSTEGRLAELQQLLNTKDQVIAEARKHRTDDTAVPTIPGTGGDILSFVPRGYVIFEKVQSDFNGDRHQHAALVLRPILPNDLGPRPLIILLAEPSRGYKLSARNDRLAPTGVSGGVANPNGADVLKSRGKHLLVQDYGGAAPILGGIILEFALMNDGWWLVSSETWDSNTRDDVDSCGPERVAEHGWNCPDHRIRTNYRNGSVVESWVFTNDAKGLEHKRRVKRVVQRKELKRFQDIGFDDYD